MNITGFCVGRKKVEFQRAVIFYEGWLSGEVYLPLINPRIFAKGSKWTLLLLRQKPWQSPLVSTVLIVMIKGTFHIVLFC